MMYNRGDAKPANWPAWLRNADIEWCDVSVADGRVVWSDGEWRGGEWRGGEWHDGIWHAGIWRAGAWIGGDWYCGEWRGGVWLGGDWLGGEWGRRYGGWRGAMIAWPGHGECGRTLRTLMHDDGRVQHTCECFDGDDAELLAYIDEGDPALKASRLLARRVNLALLDGTAEEVFI